MAPMNAETDHDWMKRVLLLAQKARGKTSPNPMVGAVAVQNGKVVGEGYHHRAGGPHAEVIALKKAGQSAKGCDLYVNLEPCCHHGRTPPCVDLIIASGVRRVIVGMRDPNPLVAGGGIRRLKSAGIEVLSGVMKKQCNALNEVFIKYIQTSMPFVILKAAMSLDGKIATSKGESQWITGTHARAIVHEIRAEVDAILIGAGSVVKDNPSLTARPKKGKVCFPTRVILDNEERVSLTSKVFNNAQEEKVIYVAGLNLKPIREQKLIAKGVDVLKLRERRGLLPMKAVMKELAQREISSVLIEGGGEVYASALKEAVVDRVVFFYAPKIIGGRKAPSAVGGDGVARLQDALKLKDTSIRQVGDDWMVDGRL